MPEGKPRTPLGTLTFRLGVLGGHQEAAFTGRLAQHGVKPKHVALLSALRLGADGTQQDLAELLGIAPSLVVSMADQLEQLGAVRRVRDAHDRRRQSLVLTASGERLLAICTEAALALDEQLLAALDEADRVALYRIAQTLAVAAGLPDRGD